MREVWRPLTDAGEPASPLPATRGRLADLMPGLSRGGRRLAVGLLDLLWPPGCPACRRRLAGDRGLCGDCWAEITFLAEPWCERLGTPFPYDLGPGTLSARAIADPPPYGRARAAVAYEGVAADLVQAMKYADRPEISALLAPMMLRAGRDLFAPGALLVPVPIHPLRLIRRRYNQAALLSARLARLTGLDHRPDALVRRRQTSAQVGLGREARADNMRGAFALARPAAAQVAGRAIILVDDVLTTGATVEAATRTLLRARASSVDVLTFARVVDQG